MSTAWKNTMIEQGFNYANSCINEIIDFFETRVEKLQSREKKKKSSMASKKKKEKKFTK